MNLLDRNFPDDLAEQCKAFSRRLTATDAVKDSLYRLFRDREELQSLRVKHAQLKNQLDGLLRALQAQGKADSLLKDAIKKASDPNAFFLEPEVR